MFTIKRVIIAILTFFTILILVYSSYFYNAINKSFVLPSLQNKQVWEYFFTITNGEINENETGNILLSQFHTLNSLISTNKDIQINDSHIKLPETGSSFLQFLSDEKEYTISGKGFTFSIQHPADILVSSSETHTLILPLNTKINISLINTQSNEIANSIILYPHEYIVFKPDLNKLVGNADVSRIQQIFTINYTDARLKSGNTINKGFLESLLKIDEQQKLDIQNIIQIYIQEKLNQEIAITTFLEQKFINITGQEMIEKYFVLFLNPEKKKAYYKNKVLSTFSKVLQEVEIKEHKDKVLENLAILKDLDIHEYSQMISILQEHLINYIGSSAKSIEKKWDMYELFLKLSGNTENINKPMFSYYNSFIAYDIYNGENFYSIINKYTEDFDTSTDDRTTRWYLVYYLNKVLLGSFSHLSNGNAKEVEDILGIFNTYVTLSKDYYIANTLTDISLQGKMRQTGVKEYWLLLDKIGSSFQEIFFEKNRDEVGRLIKKDTHTLDRKTINTFEKNIGGLQNFYHKYKKYLTDSRINILNKKRFSLAKRSFQEYLSALKDYDKYLSENDEKNRVFLWGGKQKQQEKLSERYAKTLLGNFNNVDISRATIESKNIAYCIDPNSGENDGDPYCYQVNNMKVGNRFFNLILIPSENNKITNIFLVDTNKKPLELQNGTEIKIDNIRKQLSGDEYTYKNFIARTFGKFKEKTDTENKTTSGNTVDVSNVFNDEVENTTKDEHEAELLRTVKNTLLLGKKWVFTQVQDFMNVKYNNIKIQASPEKEQYNINLSWVEVHYSDEWEWNITGILNSSYIFKVGTTNSFRSPKISIASNSNNLGFFDYTYELIGIVAINDLKKHLSTLAKLDKQIMTTVNLANKKVWPSKLHIKYYLSSNTVVIHYGKLVISINAKTKLIKKMHYKWKNYLTKLVSFDNLETYINSLP